MDNRTFRLTPKGYFSEVTLMHLRPMFCGTQKHLQRSLDAILGAKLTLAYGKYHLMMLHRQLAFSKENTTYEQAEISAHIMNQITCFHSSPHDFLHTQEESVNETIDMYKDYKKIVAELSDEHFVPKVVDKFCRKVYDDEEHFIFFKPFCNLYYSVYADALLKFQQGEIGYDVFCWMFQELSWMDGTQTPLDGTKLRRYIATIREVVDLYKVLKGELWF